MSLWIKILNHIQAKVNDARPIHGLQFAKPDEIGTVAAAGKLVRLDDTGNLDLTDSPGLLIKGSMRVEGNLDVTGSGSASAAVDQLAGELAALDLRTPRVKIHPLQVATADQLLFDLVEPYKPGTLLVWSGGVFDIHFAEISPTQIMFITPRVDGEFIKIVEIQIGSDDGTTVVDNETMVMPIEAEVPLGMIDSTDGTDGNGYFTILTEPDPDALMRIYISGGAELQDDGWNYLGNKVFEIFAPYKPITGETVTIYYRQVPPPPATPLP